MGIRPIDMMMTITQSQNLKPPDLDNTIKIAHQTQIINDQNIKNKESVSRIPDDENNTEIMDTIKQGMTDNNPNFQEDSQQHDHKEKQIHKALLDEYNGNSLDITG